MTDTNLGGLVWDPVTNTWIASNFVGTTVAKLQTADIVGGQGNFAGMAVAAMKPVDIAPAAQAKPDNGRFSHLIVEGSTELKGPVFYGAAQHTEWFDCSPTDAATVYLALENGPMQYLYLTRDTTVWLPTMGQYDGSFSLLVEQDDVGGWVINWYVNVDENGNGSVPWTAGLDPVMNPAPNAVEEYSFSWCKNLNGGDGNYIDNALFAHLTEGQILTGNLARAVVTADKIYAGTITSYMVNIVNKLRGCTVQFYHLADNLVGWYAGMITLAQATYSPPAGSDPSVDDVTWGTVNFSIIPGAYVIATGSTYYAYVTYAVDAWGEPASIGAVTWATSYPTGLYDIVLAVVTADANGKIAVEVVGTTGTIINGDHITTGSITAVNIAAGTITADKLSAFYIQVGGAAGDVNGGVTTIDGGHIETGTIVADKMDVGELSAISADIGTVTAGILQSTDELNTINLTLGTFTLANGALVWDGSILTVTGNITASGLVSGATITAPIIQSAASGYRMVMAYTGLGYLIWYGPGDAQLALIAFNGADLTLGSEVAGGKVLLSSSLSLASGKGISFNGKELYVLAGSFLMFGNTLVATYS